MYERSLKAWIIELIFFIFTKLEKIFLSINMEIFSIFSFFFIDLKLRIIWKNKNYDLIIIFKGLYLNKNFASQIKSICKNSKLINIFTDNPFDTNYLKIYLTKIF